MSQRRRMLHIRYVYQETHRKNRTNELEVKLMTPFGVMVSIFIDGKHCFINFQDACSKHLFSELELFEQKNIQIFFTF